MGISIPIPVLRFFAAHDLPFTAPLLRRAGVWTHPPWRNAPPRTCRGKWHGYRMTLDMRDLHQRGAYFYGRLLDLFVQLAVRAALRPGDEFHDIGANIGVLTLQGARCVGPQGVVHAFEPNPEVFARLEAHIRGNNVTNVRLHRVALSDRDGTHTLSVPPTGNTGAGSLGGLAPRHKAPALAAYAVPLQRGDDVLASASGQSAAAAPLLIKVDVEGHEPFTLRGLERTIRSRHPAIIAEINEEMLRCNGSGTADLLAVLEGWGYQRWALGARWSRLRRRWTIALHPTPPTWRPPRTVNAIFLAPGGVHHRRLAHFVAPA